MALICISCNREVTDDYVRFKCPSCKKEIIRCLDCRKKTIRYICSECKFEGP